MVVEGNPFDAKIKVIAAATIAAGANRNQVVSNLLSIPAPPEKIRWSRLALR